MYKLSPLFTRNETSSVLVGDDKNISGYLLNPCFLNRERDALGTALGVSIVWNPYRITPIHWLMAWMPSSAFLRRLLILANAQSAPCPWKGPCRQREELGSKRSISFPIQRTRVTRVTQDVLFNRFIQCCVKLRRFGNDIPNTPS